MLVKLVDLNLFVMMFNCIYHVAVLCCLFVLLCRRLRVVSNFGDGDCGAGEIHTHVRNFEETRCEGSAEISWARVCILPAPQAPSLKLETTRSLVVSMIYEFVFSTLWFRVF